MNTIEKDEGFTPRPIHHLLINPLSDIAKVRIESIVATNGRHLNRTLLDTVHNGVYYLVVIMDKQTEGIFHGGIGAYWNQNALEDPQGSVGSWKSFEAIPEWVYKPDGIPCCVMESEFSDEEMQLAQEIIG